MFDKIKAAYLSDLKISSKSAATYAQYAQVLNNFCEWLNGAGNTGNGTDTAEEQQSIITPLTISAYKQHLAAKGVSNNSMLHYLTMLRSAFRWAIENGLHTTEQPVTPSLLPKPEQIKHDVLTLDEIRTLLTGKRPPLTNKHKFKRNRAIVIFLIMSGVRVSELINIKIGDLDYEHNSVYIDHGKGDKSRCAPLTSKAQFYIRDYLDERRKANSGSTINSDSFLFASDDGITQLNRNAVSRFVEGYVARLTGHEGITAHDLRHAAASLWDDRGANIRDVQKALGHSSVETTEKVYVQILNKKKAAERISKIFE